MTIYLYPHPFNDINAPRPEFYASVLPPFDTSSGYVYLNDEGLLSNRANYWPNAEAARSALAAMYPDTTITICSGD